MYECSGRATVLHYPWHRHLRGVSKMLKVFMLNFLLFSGQIFYADRQAILYAVRSC